MNRHFAEVRGKTSRGFSLVELSISMFVMAIVTAQVLLSFSSQHRNYIEQEQVIETQQDVRMVADVILSEIRMAGYMVGEGLAIGSLDGDTTASDVLCVSDPEVIADDVAVEAAETLPGGDIATSLTAGNTVMTLSSGELDIDDDGDVDFEVDGGLLISDGNRVHCAVITAVNDPEITFTPAISAGASFSQLDAFAVPAVVYEVRGSQLFRNNLLVSTQIEDLQVRFGIDDDENNEIEGAEFPIDDLGNTHDLGQIRTAQLVLTSRSSRPHPSIAGQRTAAANRVAGAADKFKRRRVTVDVALRNVR